MRYLLAAFDVLALGILAAAPFMGLTAYAGWRQGQRESMQRAKPYDPEWRTAYKEPW